ncbi:hypothetical protein OPU71_19465 [Niveibacterium sp. 24ML]|uniref:imm11 family protein n=1 Tax=Niveibacterium sp. 24ML TaxID=2985512 RepID=UPI0022701450|nr:DUF1629 domain-containing protein [Niveibacterium sp. 24ML]MCX9158309.1 hypothetical protein [Niveibacterium sp. 24ML]
MHYLLRSARETYPSVELRSALAQLDWVSGTRFSQPIPALEFELEVPHGFSWPDYLRPNSAIPLFSGPMCNVLQSAGVSNIDYYPARVTNTATGETREYRAANIIGIVAAMDRVQSVFEPARRHPVMVRSIDRLVIDETRCHGLRMFRLAEYDLLVLVDAQVAAMLDSASLTGIRIEKPSDWDGFAD